MSAFAEPHRSKVLAYARLLPTRSLVKRQLAFGACNRAGPDRTSSRRGMLPGVDVLMVTLTDQLSWPRVEHSPASPTCLNDLTRHISMRQRRPDERMRAATDELDLHPGGDATASIP